MVPYQYISSLDLPALAPYRTMRRQDRHREQGIFVAEGEKVVRRLFESNLTIISLLLPTNWLESLSALIQQRREHIDVFVAEKQTLETLTGFHLYQGVMAVGVIPKPLTFEEAVTQSPSPRLFAAVEGV